MGRFEKNSAKRKWKEKSSKPKKNYRKHPLKRHPFFESKCRAFWSYSIHFAKAANSSRWFVRRSFQNFFKIYLLFLWKVPSWLVGAVFRKFFNSRATQYPLLLKISGPFLQKNLKQLRTNPKKFPNWLVEGALKNFLQNSFYFCRKNSQLSSRGGRRKILKNFFVQIEKFFPVD